LSLDNPYTIFIPIEPVAKGRPRLGKFGAFTPKKTKTAEMELRYWFAKEGVHMFSGPLRVDVTFHMPRPKSLKKGTIYHIKRPDADNAVKMVMDAGNGYLWEDDSIICDLRVIKRYAPLEFPHGITICVSNLE
jgi:Holliday junction resolvase RusA-like endonuclease